MRIKAFGIYFIKEISHDENKFVYTETEEKENKYILKVADPKPYNSFEKAEKAVEKMEGIYFCTILPIYVNV